MGFEIEKKFLLKNKSWKSEVYKSIHIKQGYLSSEIERTVRIRVTDNEGLITIKGKTENLTRAEFEYKIPISDAIELLVLCESPLIEKTRYLIKRQEVVWEVDEFLGANSGLIVAEVELCDENQSLDLPDWIGEEVSMDPKYYNSALIANPFMNW